MGMSKTKEQCWELLKEDVASFEKGIANSLLPLVELSQKEFDVYVSFAYNVGLGAWSTRLKIAGLLLIAVPEVSD